MDFLGIANVFGTPTFNVTWWYIPYAIFFILIIPALIKVFDRLKFAFIPIILLFQRVVFPDISGQFFRYLPVLILGISFAKYNIFEKVRNSNFARKRRDIVLSLLLLAVSSYVRQNLGFNDISEALMAASICYLSYRCISPLKIVGNCLGTLGKYSMNMFMLHTFIYYYYFKKYIYSFRSVWSIFLVLLFSSFVLAVLVEKIKSVVCYNKLLNCCETKVIGFIQRIS